MLVRVLGQVALQSDDGVVPLPGRQAALLAALAARSGEVVSVDRLVDLLWPDRPPENPTSALHSTVFKLRARLARVSARELLLTREPGYLLDLPPGELDAQVFTNLVGAARHEDPAGAAETLGRALDLWRGAAYGRFAAEDLARVDAVRLEELRHTAVENRAAALLESGRAAEAIAVLQPHVAGDPLQEGARIALMRALHAAGRTSEALEQFHEHRMHLAEELGLEPSAAMHAVQAELLRAATGPEVDVPPAPAAPLEGLPGMRVRYLRTEAGHVLAYGQTGTGPKVVVLLGWVSSLDVLASGRDPRSSLLQRLSSRFALTLFDRAGTGLSPGPVADYGLEASVAELRDIVDAVGPPVSLLAMSAAGPIALTLAHRSPELVDSLVLFGTLANAPTTFTDERLKAMVVEIARSHWGIGSRMMAELYRPGLSDNAVTHLAKVFRDSAAPEVAAAYLEGFYDQDVSRLLPEIEVPALVLHYRSDRLIPFRGGQELAAGLPQATFVPLDGRVHLPDAGDLDLIEDAILTHVTRNVGRAGDRSEPVTPLP